MEDMVFVVKVSIAGEMHEVFQQRSAFRDANCSQVPARADRHFGQFLCRMDADSKFGDAWLCERHPAR
jgi:hypothetical protein